MYNIVKMGLLKLNIHDIENIYNRLKQEARELYIRNKFNDSLNYIYTASHWMYLFNLKFSDCDLDELIKKIGNHFFPKRDKRDICTGTKIVFIDGYGLDNRCLTQQYIRGFISLGIEFVYILHGANLNIESEIIEEISVYKKASIYLIDSNEKDFISPAIKMNSIIADVKPSKIFLHIRVCDVVSLLALTNISENSVIYNINLTDHAFWLGSYLINYNIEFRDFGASISLQKRGLNETQLIKLPYYPIKPKIDKFLGLPILPKNSIKILTGGMEYKMLGERDAFFYLMDQILNLSPNTYILVAGISTESSFYKKVKKMNNWKRVIMLGNRTDIWGVYMHVDIYLSSYPILGGLMTQYAAENKLPIISFGKNKNGSKIEDLVNHKRNGVLTHYNIDELLKYASKIIYDTAYRNSEGKRAFDAMYHEHDFVLGLRRILNGENTGNGFCYSEPDYFSRVQFYLDNENIWRHNGLRMLIAKLRFQVFKFLPMKNPMGYLSFFFNWVKDIYLIRKG